MRLRFRYGVELSLDEYRKLCNRFKERSIANVRFNHMGDIEGWVEIKGVWVCAHFKVAEGLIASFMPAPPEREPLKNEDSKVAKLQKDLEWFKAQFQVIAGLLAEDSKDLAIDTALTLAKVDPALRPGCRPNDAERIQESISKASADRAYWVSKFSNLRAVNEDVEISS
jgi:hypothetical protein